MKYLLHLFVMVLAAVGMSSCLKDDVFSLSATDQLTFTKDTIRFDTIIAGQATHTYSFVIHNKNALGLRLSQVFLEKGAASPFFVNIDGESVNQGMVAGVEIGAHDSIRGFLFVNAPESQIHQIEEVKDRLFFVTEGGSRQHIVLEAKAQNVERLRAKVIVADETFTAHRPYQIFDSLVVGKGSTLTIEEGATLYFHAGARLVVHGQLIARGTLEKPIVFRGDRLGYMFAGQPYDRISGQWGGIVLTAGSYGNVFDYCDIHSGDFGLRCEDSIATQQKLLLENSVIHNVVGVGLDCTMAKIFVGNTQVTNAGAGCVRLTGGDYQFVHTTIANFYPFSGERGAALYYTNYEGEEARPLTAATFLNTLVTGYQKDEIRGVKMDDDDVPFQYLFQNCLLNTLPIENDDKIIDCLWDTSPAEVVHEKNFSPTFSLKELLFTFGLSEQSPAVDAAATTITQTYYPLDKKGISRLADGKADIGCYELNR